MLNCIVGEDIVILIKPEVLKRSVLSYVHSFPPNSDYLVHYPQRKDKFPSNTLSYIQDIAVIMFLLLQMQVSSSVDTSEKRQ